ncbi:MAG TPA: sulfite exporter TauE/SafE family protein [Cellvibrio sp.]|nr:sulfite exporter TauE/SafE family protein [Cellvibrio sp.]
MVLLIGLLIGLVLGLTGAGGSVFAVPLLVLLAGMPMAEAAGISLGAVAASTLYGSFRNSLKSHNQSILWLPGAILALVGAVTAPVGKWLGLQIPELILLISFCLLAMVIAVRMWRGATSDPDAARVVRAGDFANTPQPELLCNLSHTGQFELRPRCVSGLLVGGVVVGLLSGLFGVGGGFLIVPLLLVLSPISMMQAVSTSLVIIAAVSASGFASHLLMTDQSDWSLLGLVAMGGVLGMMAGQAISHKIANALLQKIFAVSLLVIALITLISKTLL